MENGSNGDGGVKVVQTPEELARESAMQEVQVVAQAIGQAAQSSTQNMNVALSAALYCIKQWGENLQPPLNVPDYLRQVADALEKQKRVEAAPRVILVGQG